jgi:hypothetical protein
MFKKKNRPTATRKAVDNVDDEQHVIDNGNGNLSLSSAAAHSGSSKSPALR